VEEEQDQVLALAHQVLQTQVVAVAVGIMGIMVVQVVQE
jgi:hypothetical protein